MIWLNEPEGPGKAEPFPLWLSDAGAAAVCFFCPEVQQSPAHFLRQAGIPAQSLTVPGLSDARRLRLQLQPADDPYEDKRQYRYEHRPCYPCSL